MIFSSDLMRSLSLQETSSALPSQMRIEVEWSRMKASAVQSRDTLQGADHLNQKVTIEPTPHRQEMLSSQTER